MTAEVIHGMSEADYHSHAALSSSGAKRLIQRCPAVFDHDRRNPPEPKDEFDFGHAAHGLVLGVGEPLAVRPEHLTSWQTKEAKTFKAEARANGHVPISAEQYQQVQDMAAAILAHPLAARLFDRDNGTPEQSIFWHDERYGVERRARLDWATSIGSLPVIVDFKTSTTANPRQLGRKIADFGYHQQVAWYIDAVHAAGLGDDPAFVFVFQEKTAPYLVSVVDIDERAVAFGRELNDRALEMFRDCTESGVWPAYLPGDGVTTVSLPRWAYNDSEVMV